MTHPTTARLAVPVGTSDHIRGAADAIVTLLEYGDYECPHCGQAHVVVEELLEQAGRWTRLVFRHFPMSTVHPHAQHAAEAAEAAGAQGKFWEMHNLLFRNQEALEDDDLVMYAGVIGLDPFRYTSELARHVHGGRVRADFLGGVRSGVNGTPTFFINGVRHDGGYDLDTLLDAIECAIETIGSKR